jgi:hypothetical protein
MSQLCLHMCVENGERRALNAGRHAEKNPALMVASPQAIQRW